MKKKTCDCKNTLARFRDFKGKDGHFTTCPVHNDSEADIKKKICSIDPMAATLLKGK